jgi:hypothetical protein
VVYGPKSTKISRTRPGYLLRAVGVARVEIRCDIPLDNITE